YLAAVKEDPPDAVAGDHRSPLIVSGCRKETLQGTLPLGVIRYPVDRMTPCHDAAGERWHYITCAGIGEHHVLGADGSQNSLDARPRRLRVPDDTVERRPVVRDECHSDDQHAGGNQPRSLRWEAGLPRGDGGSERDVDEDNDVRDDAPETFLPGDGTD